VTHLTLMSPDYCYAVCIINRWPIMGIKAGHSCHCGDIQLPAIESPLLCSSNCPVLLPPLEFWPPRCGGGDYLSLYTISEFLLSKGDESTGVSKSEVPTWLYGVMAFVGLLLIMGLIAAGIIFAIRKRTDDNKVVVNMDSIKEGEEEMSEEE